MSGLLLPDVRGFRHNGRNAIEARLNGQTVWQALSGYAAEVAADEPVAWWRFEETAGSTVSDEAGDNDGTVFGANLNVTGAPETGSAASFDGVDDYVAAPVPASWSQNWTTTGLTVELLVRSTATARVRVMGGGLANGFGVTIGFNESVTFANVPGRMMMRLRDSDGVRRRMRQSATTSLNDGDWHHVCFTWAGGSTSIDCYVDGQLSNGSTDNQLPLTETSDLGSIAVGAYREGSGIFNYYAGDVDEPAVYNYALSAARILAHAEAAGVA